MSDGLEQAWAQLDRWRSDLVQLGRIQLERARLAARDGLVGAWLLLCVILTTSTALIAAIVLCIRGLAGGLAAATGRGWLGELAGGLIVLGTIAITAWLSWRAMRRKALERVRRNLGQHERAGT